MDATLFLSNEHRFVDSLFDEYRTHAIDRGSKGAAARRRVFEHLRRELAVHAAIEEEVLYPEVRQVVPNGESLADHALEEHGRVKQRLAELEGLEAGDVEFDAELGLLMEDVRHHVREEEQELFPELRRVLSSERLHELGEQLENAKGIAPTHPHPKAPNRPPLSTVVGAAAAVVDRVRDSVAGSRS